MVGVVVVVVGGGGGEDGGLWRKVSDGRVVETAADAQFHSHVQLIYTLVKYDYIVFVVIKVNFFLLVSLINECFTNDWRHTANSSVAAPSSRRPLCTHKT